MSGEPSYANTEPVSVIAIANARGGDELAFLHATAALDALREAGWVVVRAEDVAWELQSTVSTVNHIASRARLRAALDGIS